MNIVETAIRHSEDLYARIGYNLKLIITDTIYYIIDELYCITDDYVVFKDKPTQTMTMIQLSNILSIQILPQIYGREISC